MRGRDVIRVIFYDDDGPPDVFRFMDDPVCKMIAASEFVWWVCPGMVTDPNAAYSFLWGDGERSTEFAPHHAEIGT